MNCEIHTLFSTHAGSFSMSSFCHARSFVCLTERHWQPRKRANTRRPYWSCRPSRRPEPDAKVYALAGLAHFMREEYGEAEEYYDKA